MYALFWDRQRNTTRNSISRAFEGDTNERKVLLQVEERKVPKPCHPYIARDHDANGVVSVL